VLVISCDEDEAAANKLAALGFTVYSKELIVTGVLQQRLSVDEEAYVTAEYHTQYQLSFLTALLLLHAHS
jgi:hypothetical protein